MSDFFTGVGAAMRFAIYRGGLFMICLVSVVVVMTVGLVTAPVMACVNYGRLRRGRKALPLTLGAGDLADWADEKLNDPVPWKVLP